VTSVFLFVSVVLGDRLTAVINAVLPENVISIERPKGDIAGAEKGKTPIEEPNNVAERD
jgi:hypothetical protein